MVKVEFRKHTKYIEANKLPEDVKEGNCIKFENGKFVIDEDNEKEISNRIKNKMDNLWN